MSAQRRRSPVGTGRTRRAPRRAVSCKGALRPLGLDGSDRPFPLAGFQSHVHVWEVSKAGATVLEPAVYPRDPLTKRTLSPLTVRDDVGYFLQREPGSQDHP